MKIRQNTSRAAAVLSGILCLLLAALCVSSAIAWVQSNDAIVASSNNITSASRGITGGFETDMTKTQYLMGGTTESVRQGYVPGDRKYYTFVIDVPYLVLEAAQNRQLKLTLTLATQQGDTASGTNLNGTGNYQSFMSSLCVEQDAVEIALLSRTQMQGTNVQYDVQRINGNLHLTSSTTPSVTNDAVNSFYQSSSHAYGCMFSATISAVDWPAVANAYKWQETSGSYKVSLMVFLPIWYVDSGNAQDEQKDCYLSISDCTATYVVK